MIRYVCFVHIVELILGQRGMGNSAFSEAEGTQAQSLELPNRCFQSRMRVTSIATTSKVGTQEGRIRHVDEGRIRKSLIGAYGHPEVFSVVRTVVK